MMDLVESKMDLAVEWMTKEQPKYNRYHFAEILHPDQAQALKNYLGENNGVSAIQTANAITVAFLRCPREIPDPWRLLPFALYTVETERERKALCVLISLMQKDPRVEGTEFHTLNALFNHCLRNKLIMEETVRRDVTEDTSCATLKNWRESWKKQGNIEALMLCHGVRRRAELVRWGVETLDRITTARDIPTLEIYIGVVHAWLDTARHELYKGLASEDDGRIPQVTYLMRWDDCKEALHWLITLPNHLSDEGKRLAKECYEWMEQSERGRGNA